MIFDHIPPAQGPVRFWPIAFGILKSHLLVMALLVVGFAVGASIGNALFFVPDVLARLKRLEHPNYVELPAEVSR